jgi:hypothetical protein
MEFIEIQIVVKARQYADGRTDINVIGAIENKIMALGLLEVAKQQVWAHKPSEQSPIQPASAFQLPR